MKMSIARARAHASNAGNGGTSFRVFSIFN
jgi:hypothetical protein